MDGSGDKIKIINDRCLGCGRCIPACSRGARSIVDDTENFFEDIEKQIPVVAMIAPAAVTMFDDILKLVSYLKTIGCVAVFDVSFGAELTTKSYIEYAKKENPVSIIAQPCAAIVSFCEVYAPHLLPFLAPVHSPMLHTAIMIKKYFPQYANAKIAAISPCAAKKREFEDTGLIDYNVTILKLRRAIMKTKIDLDSFEPKDFDGPLPERAVSFPMPGGLRRSVLRDAPKLENKIRRIEGTDIVYPYLKNFPAMIKDGTAPFLIDCLSCVSGCNGGPGTENFFVPVDTLEAKIEKRIAEQIAKNKNIFGANRIKGSVKKFWNPDLFTRTYTDKSEILLGYQQPTNKDVEAIYRRMKKHTEADFLNCAACGYGSCRGMAEAIYNGLNKPENCHQYLKNDVDEKLGEHINIMENVHDGIFLLEKTKMILPSYSRILEELFRRDKLADNSFIDVLEGFIDKKALGNVKTFLDDAFDISIPNEELEEKNPLKEVDANFYNLNGSYDTRKFEFIFARIGTPGNIEKLFVLVRDITEAASTKDAGRGLADNGEDAGETKKAVIQIFNVGTYIKNPEKVLLINEINSLLIQNALSASVEEPAVRKSLGKDGYGSIKIDAVIENENLFITCGDNGSGIDAGKIDESLSKIKQKVKEVGGKRLSLKTKKNEYCIIGFYIPLEGL
ncbi:hypothetical protein FACS1894190_12860 [Spirochaetia bacterium]|nr:hypothetical protein FACS1894190_12860 [Spirochaetia bacterium]